VCNVHLIRNDDSYVQCGATASIRVKSIPGENIIKGKFFKSTMSLEVMDSEEVLICLRPITCDKGGSS
jgi:hypothetical protein